jgi:hypothetical protein
MMKLETFNNNNVDVEQAMVNLCNEVKAKYYELCQTTKNN